MGRIAYGLGRDARHLGRPRLLSAAGRRAQHPHRPALEPPRQPRAVRGAGALHPAGRGVGRAPADRRRAPLRTTTTTTWTTAPSAPPAPLRRRHPVVHAARVTASGSLPRRPQPDGAGLVGRGDLEGPGGPVRIAALPCQHWTSRTPWDRAARSSGPPGGVAPDRPLRLLRRRQRLLPRLPGDPPARRHLRRAPPPRSAPTSRAGSCGPCT
jgi:hypothetical protein